MISLSSGILMLTALVVTTLGELRRDQIMVPALIVDLGAIVASLVLMVTSFRM